VKGVNYIMFKIPQSALRYEKLKRLLEEEQMPQDPNQQVEQVQDAQQVDPNQAAMQQDPNAMQQPDGMEQQQPTASGIENAQTPEEAYKAGLIEIQNQIAMTGRKRYQRYKLNGGKDSWEIFKKNLEDTLKQELEEDCEEMFGYNPGNTTEKDLLIMIKNGIDQMNQTLQQGAQAEMEQQATQDPNAQPMQEDYDMIYRMRHPEFF